LICSVDGASTYLPQDEFRSGWETGGSEEVIMKKLFDFQRYC
jgi:hypothetical protein